MTDEPEADALRKAWQSQATEDFSISMEDIQMTAERLQREVRVRTILGVGVSSFLMVVFTIWAVAASNAIARAGAILTVAGAAYIGWQLKLIRYRRAEPGSAVTAEHLSSELMRQRDYHRGPAFWSRIVLFAPGPLILMAGDAMARPDERWSTLVSAAVFVLLLIVAIPVQRRAAAHYQRELDRIESVRGEQSR